MRYLVKEFGSYGNAGKLIEFTSELDRAAHVRMGNVESQIDIIDGDVPSTLSVAADLSGDADIRLSDAYIRYGGCEYRVSYAVANELECTAYGLSQFPVTILIRDRGWQDNRAIVYKRRKAQ